MVPGVLAPGDGRGKYRRDLAGSGLLMDVQTFTAPPVLELQDVPSRRPASEIIRGVSFTVRAGEHWAMIGPNGAGKSTLLGFCGAVTHPSSGTVHVLGKPLGRVELEAVRRAVG